MLIIAYANLRSKQTLSEHHISPITQQFIGRKMTSSSRNCVRFPFLSSFMLGPEFIHKVGKLCDSLHWHSIVQRCAATAHGTVPSQICHSVCFGFCQEFLRQRSVVTLDDEWHIHA